MGASYVLLLRLVPETVEVGPTLVAVDEDEVTDTLPPLFNVFSAEEVDVDDDDVNQLLKFPSFLPAKAGRGEIVAFIDEADRMGDSCEEAVNDTCAGV